MNITPVASLVKRYFAMPPGTALQTVMELRKQFGVSASVPLAGFGLSKGW
jgi:hypothetical protein